MFDYLILIIRGLLSAGFCILAGAGTVYVFNRIPAKWLCDYGEEPDKGMWGVRIKSYPYSGIFSLLFGVILAFLWDREILYQIPALIFLWLLLLVCISDAKYMIIPDQLLVALALIAIGFIPYHKDLLSPLLGSILGGACFFLIGLVGKLIVKKESMGFGDVKLMASIGLMAGLKGTAIIMAGSIFLAGAIMGALLIAKRVKKDDYMPLGPFIGIAAGLFIVFRPWMLL